MTKRIDQNMNAECKQHFKCSCLHRVIITKQIQVQYDAENVNYARDEPIPDPPNRAYKLTLISTYAMRCSYAALAG